MNETYSIYHWLIAGGTFAAVVFLATNVLVVAWGFFWKFVDDAKERKPNPIWDGISKMVYGSAPRKDGNLWWWTERNGDSNASLFHPSTPLVLFVIPLTLVFGPVIFYYMWQVFSLIAAIVAGAFMARGLRRHNKMMRKHLQDPEAHKKPMSDKEFEKVSSS